MTEQELDPATLQLALARLSKHITSQFPDILPLELLTIGGAVMITIIGNRNTTQDVDVSMVLACERYEHKYPQLKRDMQHLISGVYKELLADGIDIGEAWMNWSVDLVLPDGFIFENQNAYT